MLAAHDIGGLWDALNQGLWFYQPLLALLSTLLLGAYVIFTIRTFIQVNRQTDLQSEAYLIVSAQKVDTKPKIARPVPQAATDLYQKWRTILKTNLPNAVQPDGWLILKLTNRGRTDIVKWAITVDARVGPGEYLHQKFRTGGEGQAWTVEYGGHQDIVAPEATIEVPAALLGSFPEVDFSWSISYVDARDKEYERFGGDKSYADTNALALNAK
jgi:hypothetical protein